MSQFRVCSRLSRLLVPVPRVNEFIIIEQPSRPLLLMMDSLLAWKTLLLFDDIIIALAAGTLITGAILGNLLLQSLLVVPVPLQVRPQVSLPDP